MIWRRFRIPGSTSLAELHHIIQIAYNWDDEYLHQFHIHGKDYGISYVGGIAFADNAHRVFLHDFDFDPNDKFTYEYNFFQHWIIDIRIENIKKMSSNISVYCVKGNGMPGANPYREMKAIQNLFKAIANANEYTTVNDIRPLVDKLNAVRFNRRLVNHRLKAEVTS